MADTTKVAQAMLREIPVSQIGSAVGKFNPGKAGDAAIGTGCGGGCGGGCSDANHGVVFDRFGHSGITAAQLTAAHADPAALKTALKTEATNMIK
jgi:hypothetical protein